MSLRVCQMNGYLGYINGAEILPIQSGLTGWGWLNNILTWIGYHLQLLGKQQL